ncbi:MAG: acyl--CoA ligase, partial [Ruminococcus sp.]|nr:acyl--CoA ligase [Ruminococcus sp.]
IILFYAINKCGAIADIIHPLNPINTIKKTISNTCSKLFITLDNYFESNRNIIEKLNVSVIVCRVSDYLPCLKRKYFSWREQDIEDCYLYMGILRNWRNVIVEDSKFNNIAVYLHSTGTTGESKSVALSNNAISALKNALSKGVIENMNPNKNKSIMVLPLFHGFGFGVCMHAMLSFGFEIVLMPKFDIHKFANLVAERKVTICTGVPAMFSKLLKLSEKDFAKLKYLENIFVGGEKLDEGLKLEFNKRLRQVGATAELIEGYGLTEAVTVCCVNKKGESDITAVGQPLYGIKVKIIDDNCKALNEGKIGEICIGGPTLMEGYLYDDNQNTFLTLCGEKYFKTGDVGYLDGSGTLHFIERRKRIFKINGVTVFPSEIEKTIRSASEKIENCVVSFIKNNIVVFVQSRETNIKNLKRIIVNFCQLNLIKYAVPLEKNIFIYETFPKNDIGKIDAKTMKENYCKEIEDVYK